MYQFSVEEAFKKLASSPEGLSQEEITRRIEKYGPNTFEAEDKFNPLQALLNQFADPLIYILLIAAAITALIQEFIDMWVILAVVAVNAIIGFSQEIKAEQAIRSLAQLAAPQAQVIRNGRATEINSSELVPGDVVTLTSGARVPADLRLFEANRLEIDEAALTGESVGARKDTKEIEEENPSLGDQNNMAFLGTLVLAGRGKGLVVNTGQATELGKISEQVRRVKPAPTPLQVQLGQFGRTLGFGIVIISGLAVLLGLILGRPLAEMLLTGIALAVGAIPEGLPIVVTITLAIGVKKMAGQNAIIRRLPAVETLGSTTVIASDKTGTLTKNQMTVQKIVVGDNIFKLTGVGFEPTGEVLDNDDEPFKVKNNPVLKLCLRAGLLANESSLGFNEEQGYYPQGDPTEVALIVAALKAGEDPEVEAKLYPKLDEIPFESDLMYMATLHKDSKGGENIIFVKGAPDQVLSMCSLSLTGVEGKVKDLENREQIRDQAKKMAEDGLRVLAFACNKVPATTNSLSTELLAEGLIYIGLQGMIDPPREEVFHALVQAKKAGVRAMMITGDHPTTAVAIARQLNMVTDHNAPVITGKELEDMSDEKLYQKVNNVNIFARVTPLHKLRVVQQLIKRGEVVAVTGDGVNDTPALKAAHIGVAIGKGGTDAAKETADMIITDNNFASIFAAVKEGRVVFDNIRKVTLFLLSTGIAQIFLILAALLFFLPLPLLPAQILWLNLVSNGLQDVALAFEPGEKGIINRPPRGRNEPVLSRLILERLIVIGIVIAAGTLYTFTLAINQGLSLDHARTIALTTIVFFQLFNVFNVRSERESIFRMSFLSNRFLFYSVVASIIAQIAVIYVPAFQFVFRTAPLSLQEWFLIIVVATTVIIVVEIEKAIRKFMLAKLQAAPAKPQQE